MVTAVFIKSTLVASTSHRVILSSEEVIMNKGLTVNGTEYTPQKGHIAVISYCFFHQQFAQEKFINGTVP